MDTRWKRSKILCSFMMFLIGVTMLIVNLVPAAGMFLALGGEAFKDEADYQESAEFRSLICGRLEDLIGVAVGGKSWVSGYDDDGAGVRMDWLDRRLNEAVGETVIEQSAFAGEYMDDEYAYYDDDYYYDYYYDDGGYAYSYGTGVTLDDYMADMAYNKNIRYAVICQNKLLYTNIEDYEERTGEAWEGTDFFEALDAEAYNFSLWYNREGDGKVQIVKDGWEQDVYGDGIYDDDSRWYVPGYANYTLGDAAKDVVVFLAAAKEPQLYLVGDYDGYGVDEYGGGLYYMRLTKTTLHRAFRKICDYLIISVILLTLAMLMRKNKRLADQRIAAVSGGVFLEIKVLLFLTVLSVLAGKGAVPLAAAYWKICDGFDSYLYWGGDITYEIAQMFKAGAYLAAFYWLFYLAVLDWKGNRKKQKKPILDLLGTRKFKYPIQKRLVRRQRIGLIIEIVVLFLAGAFLSGLCMLSGESGDYLVGVIDFGYNTWEAGYGYYSFGKISVIMALVVLGVFVIFMLADICTLRKNRRLAEDIGALADQIQAVREGNLTENLHLSEDTDLQEAAGNLNEIQKGMETALREQVKSERMKVDLVTNVSHDIKTPLTSIVSYVELLRQEQDLPEHVKEFIRILGEKSERLTNIVQDVFEVSKATSGQLPIKMETLDMGKLLRQTLADMNGLIAHSSFTMKLAIPETPMLVTADGQRLYRVFQNLLQNALSYSLEGSRIFLTLTEEAGCIVVRMKNTSSVELRSTTEFTERFVRGDVSRTDGGSGLGLSIAQSFTQACGGELTVETDADLFTVTVSFRKAESGPAVESQAP